MKRLLAGLLALVLVLGVLGMAGPADAWGGGGHGFVPGRFPHRGFHAGGFHRHFVGGFGVGVFTGFGLGALAAPYYVAPPPVVYAPPVPAYAPPPPQYWYYCQNPAGYYPHVAQCPGGWLTVVPPTQ